MTTSTMHWGVDQTWEVCRVVTLLEGVGRRTGQISIKSEIKLSFYDKLSYNEQRAAYRYRVRQLQLLFHQLLSCHCFTVVAFAVGGGHCWSEVSNTIIPSYFINSWTCSKLGRSKRKSYKNKHQTYVTKSTEHNKFGYYNTEAITNLLFVRYCNS